MGLRSASSSGIFTTVSFDSLPYELRSRIIEEACASDDCIGLFGHKDVVNFMLASRSVYATAASYLYKAIWITSPTTIAAFSRAIVSKPALGRLVKALPHLRDTSMKLFGHKDLVNFLLVSRSVYAMAAARFYEEACRFCTAAETE